MAERKRIKGELCERVEKSDQLRDMAVIWTSCDWCGGGKMHRGAVLNHGRYNGGDSIGAWGFTLGWELMPPPGGARHPRQEGRYIVADDSILAGYVWRVIDEQADGLTLADVEQLERVRKLADRVGTQTDTVKPIAAPREREPVR